MEIGRTALCIPAFTKTVSFYRMSAIEVVTSAKSVLV
jgi:hypothetical protein